MPFTRDALEKSFEVCFLESQKKANLAKSEMAKFYENINVFGNLI
jgi:hypothetical protein